MKILKFFIALFLLPFLTASCVFGHYLVFQAYVNWSWAQASWFLGGFLLWVIYFFFLPRPNWLYVFGHECTHALAVVMSGGKIDDFKVTSRGGQVVCNKMSAWIALSPYLVPLYPLIIGLIWGVLLVFLPKLSEFQNIFLFTWGLTWSFHVTFTLYVMGRVQTDFSSQGYIFSFVVIALVNLWMVLILAWWWLQPFGLKEGAGQFLDMLMNHYGFVWDGMMDLMKNLLKRIATAHEIS